MAKNKPITYASIVPLIGGENFGIHASLNGQLPEYVLSYTPFQHNDKHYIEYLRKQKQWKGDYVFLDEKPDYRAKRVDAVNAVCPCAGLSALSGASNANSPINDWIYKSAEYVLETIKPTVFWGENAPALGTLKGRPVADKLHGIARKNGYSLTLYSTESRLHGLSQKRARCFYFLVKGDRAPILNLFNRPPEAVEDILNLPAIPDDPMDILINKDDPMDCAWLRYCMEQEGCTTIKQYHKKITKSVGVLRQSVEHYAERDMDKILSWLATKNFNASYTRRAESIKKKVTAGMGYWAHNVTLLKGVMPGFVSWLPYAGINAQKNRYLTIREALRIMKMPDDFMLASVKPLDEINHICQNVPVTTAKDMADEVTRIINGACEFSDSSYIRQCNKNGEIASRIDTPISTLSAFL